MSLRHFMLGAVSLASAFSLAACSKPTPEEIAAHSALANQVAAIADGRCAQGDSTYQQRLHQVLEAQSSQTLQTLADRNITLCLDQRLTDQHGWGRSIEMIYYGRAGVVSIPDNKKAYDPDAWFQDNPAFGIHTRLLSRLAEGLASGKANAAETYYGYSRKPHKRSRRYYWKNESELGQDRFNKNPWLRTAPVAAQAQPVRSSAPSASW